MHPNPIRVEKRIQADQSTPIGGVVDHCGLTCKLVNKGTKKWQLKQISNGRIITIIAPR